MERLICSVYVLVMMSLALIDIEVLSLPKRGSYVPSENELQTAKKNLRHSANSAQDAVSGWNDRDKFRMIGRPPWS
ncbi:hypothetical protein FACS189449_03930 [Alphaproteobacteria bacterium]|nr:hypothetical protein FACS189449_03930 [Alphaproteobacteria bacterium]